MKKLFLVLTMVTSFAMAAQENKRPTVDVSGEGIVKIVPDQVNITVRVEKEGKDAEQVKKENDKAINEVISFLKKMNIDEKDFQTKYIRLNKNYDYNTKTYSYSANQSIDIKLKDLSKYEKLMDGLLESGINRIDGVSFASSKQDALEAEARKKAVMNAKQKAEEYASALGQSIGMAVSISEFQQSNTPVPMYRGMAMKASDGSEGQTIAPGELEISVSVNVSFQLFEN